MRALILTVALLAPTSALALDCIPEPAKLTFGDKASDDYVRACEHQFRNPLPACHRLYAKPDDRALCLGVIVKLDAYDKQKPTHNTRAKMEAQPKSVPLPAKKPAVKK